MIQFKAVCKRDQDHYSHFTDGRGKLKNLAQKSASGL